MGQSYHSLVNGTAPSLDSPIMKQSHYGTVLLMEQPHHGTVLLDDNPLPVSLPGRKIIVAVGVGGVGVVCMVWGRLGGGGNIEAALVKLDGT